MTGRKNFRARKKVFFLAYNQYSIAVKGALQQLKDIIFEHKHVPK